MEIKPKIILIIYCIIIYRFSVAQSTDSVVNINTQIITDRLEDIAQTTDLNLDYNDLVDDYLQLMQNPVNINSEDISILRDLYLINDNQLNNLQNYLKTYGPMFSSYELVTINGFTEETMLNIQPFITVDKHQKINNISPNKIAKYGKHQLILRYNQVLEKQKGYELSADSAINYPGSVYLGNPMHYYLRYSFNYKNKIKAGITIDKDAGEIIFKNDLSDTLQQLIGDKVNTFFDFISVFAYAEDISFVNKIVVGDYHLEFGQGLTLWTGLSFGKSGEGVSLTRYGRGIRPNTSANENRFFRGAATSLGFNKIQLTAFYSSNSVDGNTEFSAINNEEQISSIIETGMHRTINEILDKRTLKIKSYGGNIHYHGNWFNAGITGYRTLLDKPITTSDEPYKIFRFSGDNLTNFGADVLIIISKASIFAETAISSNSGFAVLSGINTFLNDRFNFSVVYHNYDENYQNLYCNPFAESSTISNESGFYIGFNSLISKSITLSGYIDYYTFPWLKYQTDAPSHGNDFLVQLNITPSTKVYGNIRARFKTTQENYNSEWYYVPEIKDVKRNEIRLFISYEVTEFLIFKNRADIVLYSDCESNEKGYMLYHDALLRRNNFPVDLTFRLALFSTDSYNSRIYTYENDVLYAFTIPSYFDDGLRWYIMLKWEMLKNASFWVKYSATKYFNRDKIGSGNDIIDGNRKSEIKAQLIIKL